MLKKLPHQNYSDSQASLLIYAATTAGATVKVLSEEHNTEEIAKALIRQNFGFGGAEMSFAAHYPHDVQHYATYFCKDNDRFIMIGFLSP
uniref:Uncharacterized protein n=1 Tax=Panagrolaimus superbus TaxID=310955 RepID=A0A914XU58_9BILA